MSEGTMPMRVRYLYEQDDKARVQYAHGVWGGINPQGEIELNFYLESDKLPPYSERVIAPDGGLGPETAPEEDASEKIIMRHIHSKLLLNYHTARAVLEWLQEKVDALESEVDDMMFMDEEEGMPQ